MENSAHIANSLNGLWGFTGGRGYIPQTNRVKGEASGGLTSCNASSAQNRNISASKKTKKTPPKFTHIFGAPSNTLSSAQYLSGLQTKKMPFSASSAHLEYTSPNLFFKEYPTTLYHGTTLENALEIYTTGLWMIGYAMPPAVWMGDSIEIAIGHSGSNGGIVTVSIDPDLPLKNLCGGIYIYEIPNARPKQEYYRIQGLTPTGVVSPQGNRIR
jgi:hypothetical protein